MYQTTVILPAERLHALICASFGAMGWPQEDAATVADHLVLSDQSGHPSHGTGMMDTYVQSFRSGALGPERKPLTGHASPPFHVVDANYALGHVVMMDAVRTGAAIVRSLGVAIVNVVRAHHIGRVGHYAEVAAEAGLVSMFWSNVYGRPALVAPFGGTEARLGTNPHCIGVPRLGQPPLILDMATSRIALGKTRVAQTQGLRVPAGCLLDPVGMPTTDPGVMFSSPAGCLLPFGDHKGAGIGLLAEVLSSAFTHADTIATNAASGLIVNNTLFLLLDPKRLGASPDTSEAVIRTYVDWVTSARQADLDRPILLPGEPERQSRARMGDDVWLSSAAWDKLVRTVEQLDVLASDIQVSGKRPS